MALGRWEEDRLLAERRKGAKENQEGQTATAQTASCPNGAATVRERAGILGGALARSLTVAPPLGASLRRAPRRFSCTGIHGEPGVVLWGGLSACEPAFQPAHSRAAR